MNMKTKILITILTSCIFSTSTFGQNKKEQIEILNSKVDSLKNEIVIRDNQMQEYVKQTKLQIENLESEVEKKVQTIVQKDQTIKSSNEKNAQLESDISKYKQQIDYLNKNYIPVTKINYKVQNKAEDEIAVLFYIENHLIATFIDYGTGESDCGGLRLYSEISQKSYLIEIVNNKTIKLRYETYFDGEQSEVWVRTYIQENEKWKQSKCDGECN